MRIVEAFERFEPKFATQTHAIAGLKEELAAGRIASVMVCDDGRALSDLPEPEPEPLPVQFWQRASLHIVGSEFGTLRVYSHPWSDEWESLGGRRQILLRRRDVLKLLPELDVPSGSRGIKAGRPQEHDWDGAAAHLREKYPTRGSLPEVGARVIEVAEEWFCDVDGGKAPDKSEIRKKLVRPLYEAD